MRRLLSICLLGCLAARSALGAPTAPPGGAAGPAAEGLSQALDRALDMLGKEKAEGELLRARIAALRTDLAERRKTAAELESRLQARDAMLKDLETDLGRWKDQVIGSREEILRAQEVEREALGEIAALLRALQRNAPPLVLAPDSAAPGAAGPNGERPGERHENP